MVTVVELVTLFVLIEKLSDDAPAAISTCCGTETLGSLDVRAISYPPTAAAPLIVIVPDDWVPPTTALGEAETDARPVGVMVRLAAGFPRPADAVRFAVWLIVAPNVAIEKLAWVPPAGIVTVAG